MLVKKFEADTLEEALKAVKVELGPDAIILKTITNKGLKGTMAKKRIEITAAISEKNFEMKSNKAAPVFEMDKKDQPSQKAGYGNLGLNKMVNTIQKGTDTIASATSRTTSILKNSLDDFLNSEPQHQEDDSFDDIPVMKAPQTRGKYAEPPAQAPNAVPSRPTASQAQLADAQETIAELKMELRQQHSKMDMMERKLQELTAQMGQPRVINEAQGLSQLRHTLRVLDVQESFILEIIRKAQFDLTPQDLGNPDVVFEYALKEMTSSIKTDLPLFARGDQNSPVVTILVSETASGQTTLGMKIAVLKKDVTYVQCSQDPQNSANADFASQVFNIPLEKAQNLPEVVSLCRQAVQKGKSVLVDLHLNARMSEDSKKFIDALRRSLPQVEVLCTLSAIHSELYNRKIIARYKDITDGIIISHVDLCMSFGAIYNLHRSFAQIPLKFFGTGPVVPDDIEAASAERLLAGLFQL